MAVLLLMMMMAQRESNAKNTTDEVKPAIFHDFLGRSCASDSSPAATVKPGVGGDGRVSEASLAASASVGGSSGGGRGPISATSDLGSERQVANHFEGVPFYGPRSDLTGTEMSNRFAGNKRSNSDSAFTGSSRDGFPQAGPESFDGLHLMKILRNAGGERPRHSHDEAMFFGTHPMRPTPTSRVLQPPTRSRTDASGSKWERAIPLNVGPSMQYPPRVGQVATFGGQVPSNRFKDANLGPSAISQAAADEGSRTGIKGSGILSSINASSGVSDRNPSGVLLPGSKQKSGTHNSEPESLTPRPSQHGSISSSRQMTIFYGGQAHVFDDVHPNKADVIMALAGSNGGSWSTTFVPNSTAPVPGESYIPSGEKETGMASNFASSREFQRRLSMTGTSNHGFGSGDQISVPPGSHQGSTKAKDGKAPVQAETRTEGKQERVD
ncbi:Protein TIFY 8 [Camellia lanceoleosa]|uniref:Protein TIFY 8 n=1 Tax=Camellia lanceoleosa TaxID=1840588 RepID=A0ACC0FG53_9ERIC|nr:Protein TIFY 8 [Camellia lanceoleosa]